MTSLVVHPGSAVELSAFPLSGEQILEGEPAARIWINAQSADRTVTQGVWDCTAGRFTWDFVWDEFVMVLEGEVSITPEGGEPVVLRKGDFCHFPAGLKTVWQVDHYVRKTFTLRTAEPLEL